MMGGKGGVGEEVEMNENYVNRALLYEILKRIKIILKNYGWVIAYWIKVLVM